jgi:pilus assembly protein FimV
VEDKKPLTAAPDKLTLTKGAVQGRPAEDQLATERAAKEAASRAAEISRNINDLGKLGAASTSVVPAGVAASGATSAQPAPATVVAAVAPPLPTASAPLATSEAPMQTASAPASAPAASAVAKPVAIPAAPPEVGMVDGLIENPLVPAGAIGLIALLAGFGLYRARQRKNAAQADSIFLESRLRPDSFFGASGGQSVDTNDNAATGSSMVYSPSQLDAVDDVDPVAEADVYLAYGRDLQAEEILKDALRTNPGRLAIHHKLLEIYAKRRDTKAFEETATLAFRMTNGEGSEWDRICELGLSIDPANGLYQPGGQPNPQGSTPSRPVPLEYASNLPDSAQAVATQTSTQQGGGSSDLDLDLDFSLDEEPTSVISEARASEVESGLSMSPDGSAPSPLDLDFGLATEALEPFEAPQVEAKTNAVEFSLPDLALGDDLAMPPVDSEEFKQQAATSFGATIPVPLNLAPSEPAPPPAPDLSMLEFDLGSLSLDLGETPEIETTAAGDLQEDPLTTKLALAEEFRAIGDDDGARALIEEVISEASGDMKIKAQRALSNL